ncbi:MAG: hypothetical protein HY042_04130 [Spirochaetia bacterium]|nr:hypothetical protein [Spirochaetia bacterium]
MNPLLTLPFSWRTALLAAPLAALISGCAASSAFAKLGAEYTVAGNAAEEQGWIVEVLRVQEESKNGSLLLNERVVQAALRITNKDSRFRSFRFQAIPISQSNFTYLLHADRAFKAGYEKNPEKYNVDEIMQKTSAVIMHVQVADPDNLDPIFLDSDQRPMAYTLGGDCEWNYYEVYCKAFSRWLAPGQTYDTTVRFLVPDGAVPLRISAETIFKQSVGPFKAPAAKQ